MDQTVYGTSDAAHRAPAGAGPASAYSVPHQSLAVRGRDHSGKEAVGVPQVAMPVPVARLINAVNSGDGEAFLAAFAEDGVVDDCGRLVEGRRAIGAWSGTELVGDGCRITVQGVTQSGGEVEVAADVVSMGFNGPTTFLFALAGDLVTLMRLSD